MAEPKRPSLWDEFPGFKILKVAEQEFGTHRDTAWQVECKSCFRGKSANWSRPRAIVVGGRGVRKWISEHEHGLTFEQAVVEWMACIPGNKTAKRKLSGYYGMAGWKQPMKSIPTARLAEYYTGSPDPAVQAHALALAVSEARA